MGDRGQVVRCAAVATLVGLLPGCGLDEPCRGEPCLDDVVEQQAVPAPGRAEQVARLRETIMATINASVCPGAGCEMVSFQPVPAVPWPASEGARILLIDEAIVTVAATRYQGRTLHYLTHDANGTYRTSLPTLQIARDALTVLQAADRFLGPLASEELDVVVPFAAKFSDVIPNWVGHGMDILPFLADRIARAEFVVSEAQLDYPLSDPQICGVNNATTREAALARLDAQLGHSADSLASLIQQYAINYIHLSWGVTRSGIEASLQSVCGTRPSREVSDRIQAAYLALLSTLSGLSVTVDGCARPVVMVQAGTGADHEIHPDDPDFLSDCTAFPGRLRIFAGAYTGTDIPADGSTDPRFLTPFAQRVLGCVDLMVNVGYTNPRATRAAPTYFPTSSLGLGLARPGWPAVSSFANPVGLAYVAYLADLHPNETVAQLLARSTNQWTKPSVDPLLYGLFPRPFQPTPVPVAISD